MTNNVWFAGAGVSVSAPSCFPAAGSILNEAVITIAPDSFAEDSLRTLIWPNNDQMRGPTDFLRFESFFEALRDNLDPKLEFFDFHKFLPYPNGIHLFLAARAIDGDIIITTNFDCLIETAISKLGYNPVSVVADEDFGRWIELCTSPLSVPVFKLHGSFELYTADGGEIVQSKDSIQATLDRVFGGLSCLLPQTKLKFVQDAIENRILRVIGYSGSDDLDIMPSLLTTSPEELIWVSHKSACDPEDKTVTIISETEEISPVLRNPRECLFHSLAQSGKIRIVSGDTEAFLRNISGAEFDALIQRAYGDSIPSVDFDFAEFVRNWGARLLKPWRSEKFIGEVHFRIGRAPRARDFFEKSRTSLEALSGLESDYEMICIEMALGRVLMNLGEIDRASSMLESAYTHFASGDNAEKIARSAHDVGYCLFLRGLKSEALEKYQQAESVCREEGLNQFLGICLHDTALVLFGRGEFVEAERLFIESLEISLSYGDIRHSAWSSFQLGVIYYERADFDCAQKQFEKSAAIAALIGDFNHVSACDHSKAMILFIKGDLRGAIRSFRATAELDLKNENWDYRAVKIEHVAITLWEAERLSWALGVFKDAEAQFSKATDQDCRAEMLSYWAVLEFQSGQYEAAKRHAQEAEDLSRSLELKEFQIRSAFVTQLVNGASDQLDSLIDIAGQGGHLALAMDLISIRARVSTDSPTRTTWAELWAIAQYRRIGNSRRASEILHWLQK